MSAKFAPASTMNSAIAHWVAAPKSSIDRALVEKPPVGNVVKAWATAS